MMDTKMSSMGLMEGLSDSHPDTSLPAVLVTPIAEIRKAALEGEMPAAMAAGGRWV